MDWLDCMRNALDYIEANLDGNISIKKVAEIAASSPFHFQRMFSMLTGVTVADYIRKRRLTLSAQELAASKCKVIDAALKYGYETPESFTKAFRRLHGITPAQARQPGAELKAFPKLSFHISIKGDKDMDYRIEEKKEFEVAGIAKRISTKDGANFKEVTEFWQDGSSDKVCSIIEGAGSMYGLCMDFKEDQTEFIYMIATESPKEKQLPEGFEKRKVPAATWAVFTSVGPLPGSIQDVTKRIFSEWFPATGYEHDDAPEIENYPYGDTSSPEYRCEVWIPVKKR